MAFDKNQSYLGDIHPNELLTSQTYTLALYGGLVKRIYLSFSAALFASRVGGILIENLIDIVGKLTLPEP